MINKFKGLANMKIRFFDWLFDIEGCRSNIVWKKSLTGEPLLIGTRNTLCKQTHLGLKGSVLLVNIVQFGSDVEAIKSVLKGEFDYCLDKEQKDRIISDVRYRVSKGGQYITTKRNAEGNLDFVTQFWSTGDLDEITNLLLKRVYL